MGASMKTSSNVAYINPEILSWARLRSGVSHLQLQELLKASPEELAAWERGETHPPFDKHKRSPRHSESRSATYFFRISQILRLPFPICGL
jgi:hypothetical protein